MEYVLAAHADKLAHVLIVRAVEDLATVASVADEIEVPQDPQVVRNSRRTHAHGGGQLVHAQLIRADQRLKDKHPGRIAEYLEQIGYALGLLARNLGRPAGFGAEFTCCRVARHVFSPFEHMSTCSCI
jgi:hypothetical protein